MHERIALSIAEMPTPQRNAQVCSTWDDGTSGGRASEGSFALVTSCSINALCYSLGGGGKEESVHVTHTALVLLRVRQKERKKEEVK